MSEPTRAERRRDRQRQRRARRAARHSPIRLLMTPEGVGLPLELADSGQRAGAFIVDMLILMGGLVLVTILLIAVAAATHRLGAMIGRALMLLWMLATFVLRNLYFTWFESRPRGATPGKRLLGLRVVARHGGRLTLDAVIARNALREVEVFLPLSFLAGTMGGVAGRGLDGWMMLVGLGWSGIFLFLPVMNRDRLRAGDLLAGTWVIRVPRRPLLPELADDGAGETFTDAELEAYGVHELEALERVIRDCERDAIETVAGAIRQRIGRSDYGDRGGFADHAFLQAYYAALRARLEQRLLFGHRRRDKHDK